MPRRREFQHLSLNTHSTIFAPSFHEASEIVRQQLIQSFGAKSSTIKVFRSSEKQFDVRFRTHRPEDKKPHTKRFVRVGDSPYWLEYDLL